jgi:hypothetical protein
MPPRWPVIRSTAERIQAPSATSLCCLIFLLVQHRIGGVSASARSSKDRASALPKRACDRRVNHDRFLSLFVGAFKHAKKTVPGSGIGSLPS